MAHLPEFIGQHWQLCALFAVVLLALLTTELQALRQGSHAIEPYQVVNEINRQHAVVIDLRNPQQFQDGHIINAILSNPTDSKKLSKYKQKHLVLVCNDGQQSMTFSKELQSAGFEHVKVLKGGMTAWTAAELPTAKE